MAREKITIERTLHAPIEEVWEYLTTRNGLESWWGGEGVQVKIRALDLRPGGMLELESTAVGPAQIQIALKWRLPVSGVTRMAFKDVEEPTKLSLKQRVEYIPGTKPYDVVCIFELERAGRATKLKLTADGLHDAAWTEKARSGWESQVDALAAKIG